MSGEQVKVEPAELDAKAAEISEPMPPAPGEPLPACGLQVARDAVGELNKSAGVMLGYAKSGEAEALRLAETFRSAANAYRLVDEQAGVALDNGETAPAIPPVQPAPATTPSIPLPPNPSYQCHASPLVMLEQAAAEIAQPDQAASLDAFKSEWTAYASALEARSESFNSGGVQWEGGAAEAAFDQLKSHRRWLEEMASASRQLADEAGNFAQVHRSAVGEHPTVDEVNEINARIMISQNVAEQNMLMQIRMKMQQQSEEVLGKYAGASIATPLDVPAPPKCTPTPPASTNDKRTDRDKGRFKKIEEKPGDGTGTGGGSGAGAGGGGGGSGTPPGSPTPGQMPQIPQGEPQVSPASAQQQPSGGGSPSGGGAPSGGGSPSGGSSGGSGSGGLPSMPDLGGSPEDMPFLDEPDLSPAAAGGGSGGGSGGGGAGGGGVPSMPLQPNIGGVSVGPSPASGPGGAPVSGGGAAGGGGGMMGGGMPMGGAGHGQGGGTEKKRTPSLSPDEDLYNEDRPWTEAVIGNRPRRKDVTEGKDSK